MYSDAMERRGRREPETSNILYIPRDRRSSGVSSDLSQVSCESETSTTRLLKTTSEGEGVKKKKKKKSPREKPSRSKMDGELNDDDTCSVSSSIDGEQSIKRSKKSSKSKGEKGEKRVKKHSRRRPEPEGGNPKLDDPTPPEYDRVLNSRVALFPDLDLELLEEESQKKQTQRFYQPGQRSSRPNRGGPAVAGGGGGIFPCAQLASANTGIKFSIIATELKNVTQASNRLERETAEVNRRIKMLEEGLVKSAQVLKNASFNLAEVSRMVDDEERRRINLTISQIFDEEVFHAPESDISIQDIVVRPEERTWYEEAELRLLFVEAELERAEEKARNSERKVEQLEAEANILTNNVFVFQQSKDKTVLHEEKVPDRTQRMKMADLKGDFAIMEVEMLQKMLYKIEEDLIATCDENTHLIMELGL